MKNLKNRLLGIFVMALVILNLDTQMINADAVAPPEKVNSEHLGIFIIILLIIGCSTAAAAILKKIKEKSKKKDD